MKYTFIIAGLLLAGCNQKPTVEENTKVTAPKKKHSKVADKSNNDQKLDTDEVKKSSEKVLDDLKPENKHDAPLEVEEFKVDKATPIVPLEDGIDTSEIRLIDTASDEEEKKVGDDVLILEK